MMDLAEIEAPAVAAFDGELSAGQYMMDCCQL